MGLFDRFKKNTEKQAEENPQQEEAVEAIEDIAAKKDAVTQEKIEIEEEKTEQPIEALMTEEPVEPLEENKKGFFTKLVAGLSKTRENIMQGVDQVLKSFTKIDEELFEELEETLIMADIGVRSTDRIVESLREGVKQQGITEAWQIKELLVNEITSILQEEEPLTIPTPTVILVIGVNGVGKTTTIGKLAHHYQSQGKSVLLAAADTFRAAAIDQLEIWGNRVGVDVIKHQENSDPGAVVFDAVKAAAARKKDVLICDTAGRLHNKKNLMEELKKISKIIDTNMPEAHRETFLVLDATTGQNALQQAKLFQEAAEITGIVLTKLDGTAKGGIIIAIKSEMNIPVRFIGVGEAMEDLQPFQPEEFAKALFGRQ